jgi:hypothetical protein
VVKYKNFLDERGTKKKMAVEYRDVIYVPEIKARQPLH